MKSPHNKIFFLSSGIIAGMFLYLSGAVTLYAQVVSKEAGINPKKVEQLLEKQVIKDEDEAVDLRIQLSGSYSAGNLRDPFESMTVKVVKPEASVTKIAEAVKLPQFKITGVFWGARFPQAIINNKIVKSGDVIEGATIQEIRKDGISIMFANKEYTLAAPGTVAPENKSLVQKEAGNGK